MVFIIIIIIIIIIYYHIIIAQSLSPEHSPQGLCIQVTCAREIHFKVDHSTAFCNKYIDIMGVQNN